MQSKDWFRRMAEKHAKLAQRRKALSSDPKPRAFSSKDGVVYLVHQDPSRFGKWRVTYLHNGAPIGHGNSETYIDALKQAQDQGADLFSEVPIP